MSNTIARIAGANRLGSSGPVSDVVVRRTIRGNEIACREWGKPGNPVLIGIPGLTSNSLCFADIAEAAARAGYHVIVPDLRGRNLSPATGHMTYGWVNHAKDIAAIADAVGAKTFSVIGHSMGGYIAQELTLAAPGRIDRMVILDALAVSELNAASSVGKSVQRLDTVYASADEYVDSIKHKGIIKPFTKTWDRHYREELMQVPGGVKSRTDKDAVNEDTAFAMKRSMFPPTFYTAWARFPEKTLVVRAGVPLSPILGNFISELDADAYKALRKRMNRDELFKTVDANHYTVLTEPSTVALITRFLKGQQP